MGRIFLYAITLLLCLGCYDGNTDRQESEFADIATCDIAELRQLCSGGYCPINRDMICVGRVTSSDREGNFYRSLFIEDETGGVELKLGIYNSASQYPLGLQVALHLKGAAIALDNGVVQVGLPPYSYDTKLREFESQVVIDKHLFRSNSVVPVVPLVCDIASLDISLCGRFVCIENLSSSPLVEDDEQLMVEYHRFVDSKGDAIFTYISPYADFADMEMPTTSIDIQGILCYETVGMDIGKQFVIKPRFADDFSAVINN